MKLMRRLKIDMMHFGDVMIGIQFQLSPDTVLVNITHFRRE